MLLDSSIFKAYDIRGIVDQTLTVEVARAVGQALGELAKEKGVKSLCVARDGRLSGPKLAAALMEGITSTGVDVISIGMVPTPVLYFATFFTQTGSGIAVTGSHNPPEYNGLKMMMASDTLYGQGIQNLKDRILKGISENPSRGEIRELDVVTPYLDKVLGDVKLDRPMKIAMDCGNGVTGPLAMKLFSALGCEIVPLYTDIDGHFPHHHPDPSKPENLADLIETVKNSDAELGIAFDGDGDRLGVVTKSGQIIYPDRQMMLFAADILKHNPGSPIIYDVKCTRRLVPWIREHGGIPTICRTGHSLVKAKLKETQAPFAGEMSGHLFFNDKRWPGFDDGLYAGARLLEILSRTASPSDVLEALPSAVNTPELHIEMAEGENKPFVEKLQKQLHFDDATDIITIDGIRVEWKDGFALARPSNTTPVVVLRLEGDTIEALERIKRRFGEAIKAVDPSVVLPF
ncbi:MAG TPA: phosphomannomutase/phosphoglucomutase [Candidatus Aphodousia gallistercoris]|nr:phosphomannomutase/phosphoglucomutase [Candidatus Aphodousia gallistercoris]